VDAVVARMNLQFKTPLTCDDEFISRLALTNEGVKYVFHQDIYRAHDEKLCFRGRMELVCLVNGRLGRSEDYDRAFNSYMEKNFPDHGEQP
jgi:acyl-CoA thioester hydrolase